VTYQQLFFGILGVINQSHKHLISESTPLRLRKYISLRRGSAIRRKKFRGKVKIVKTDKGKSSFNYSNAFCTMKTWVLGETKDRHTMNFECRHLVGKGQTWGLNWAWPWNRPRIMPTITVTNAGLVFAKICDNLLNYLSTFIRMLKRNLHRGRVIHIGTKYLSISTCYLFILWALTIKYKEFGSPVISSMPILQKFKRSHAKLPKTEAKQSEDHLNW
jgi:hypothetical protein